MRISANQKYTERKLFSKKDIIAYANLVGDFNPIHLDEDYAKKTVFGSTIVHGMLAAAYFSKIIGMNFPGKGSIYLGQNLVFTSPVKPNDWLTYEIIVTEIRKDKPIVKLSTKCYSSKNLILIEGSAVVKINRSI